jgi:flagellar protein FlgJ
MDISLNQNMPSLGDTAAEKARQLKQQSNVNPALDDKQRQKLKKISQDFEGLFVGMMMKSMRDTVGKDKLTGGGHGDEVYLSMLDQEYAAASVKRGGLGLAKQIEKELVRQEIRRAPKKIDSKE